MQSNNTTTTQSAVNPATRDRLGNGGGGRSPDDQRGRTTPPKQPTPSKLKDKTPPK
ncbi:hypothetical protein [Rugamonas sp. DEMB1]|uniref:hypothetical protein n=1 Tax=Rugamonas sp. DEMB1 TaxID=3039386 RepID=UPI00244B3753|nr:hypothetical protein [Rugamonas sp. DEMB1]WGG50490.1 hypothetical protein QC826_29490 [Rugamonas sp. DEMB1]